MRGETVRKTIVGFLPFILIALVIYAWLFFHFSSTFRERIAVDNHRVLTQMAMEMDRGIQNIIRYTENMFLSETMKNAVVMQDEEAVLGQLQTMVSGIDYLTAAYVIFPDGTAWTGYPYDPGVIGVNYAFRDWYQGVTESMSPYVSAFFLSTLEPRRYVTAIAIPVMDGTEPVAIIYLQPDMDVLFEPLREPLGYGYVYAVDRHGYLIYHPQVEIDRMISYLEVPAVQNVLTQREGGYSVTYNQLENEERLSSWTMLESAQIGLIAQEPTSLAFAPIRRLTQMLSLAGVTLLVFAFLMFSRLVTSAERVNGLNSSLRRRNNLEQIYRELLLVLGKPWDHPAPLANELMGVFMQLGGAWSAVYYKLSGEGLLEPAASRGLSGIIPSYREGEGLPGRVLLEQRSVRTGNARETARLALSTGHGSMPAGEVLAIPLISGEKTVGVIELGLRDSLAEDVLSYLETAAGQAASGLLAASSREELERQRKLTQVIIDTVPDLISLRDAGGNYLAVNKAMADRVGKNPNLVPGLTHFDLFPAGEAGRYQEQDRQVVTSGKQLTIDEEVFSDKNGEETWVMTVKTPVHDAQGSVIMVVAVARDITGLKQAEARLQKQNEELHQQSEELQIQTEELLAQQREMKSLLIQLEEANNAKSTFLRNMSHELRTPLNSIIGFSEVLLDYVAGPLTEKQKDYVENIFSSGHHLLELINSILDLAKIESGKEELELKAVDPVPLFERLLAMMNNKASQNGIQLALNAQDGLPRIMADELKLKQIVLNLLSNAVKYTPVDGSITLRARIRENSGKGAAKQGEFLEVLVQDTGIGIPEHAQHLLFQEFSQLHTSHKMQEGTGLGLALCKRLVEMHGGSIWVESSEGNGAGFYFTIPLVRTGEDEVTSADGCGSGTVLVVDDNTLEASIISDFLERSGFVVYRAADGQQGMATLVEVKPDLVILDLVMPKTDGFTVLKQIQEHGDPAVSQTPVIILSSKELSLEEKKGLAGTAYVARKGDLNKETMCRVIRGILGKKS